MVRFTLLALLTLAVPASADDAGGFVLNKRTRVEKDGKFDVVNTGQRWTPKQTAVIVCDMWDAHHCLNAVRRAEEMAPRMNDFLKAARDRG